MSFNIDNYIKERYNKYKDIEIECPFCERVMNIYNIGGHIKTNRCKYIQNNKFNETDLNNKKINLLIVIDKMRYDLRKN